MYESSLHDGRNTSRHDHSHTAPLFTYSVFASNVCIVALPDFSFLYTLFASRVCVLYLHPTHSIFNDHNDTILG